MNFISREAVLAILNSHSFSLELRRKIELLPSFPAPNPDEKNNRNVMGQTEEQFWAAVEAQH